MGLGVRLRTSTAPYHTATFSRRQGIASEWGYGEVCLWREFEERRGWGGALHVSLGFS